MSSEHVVLLTEPLASEPQAWLSGHAAVQVVAPDDAGFAAALREAHGLVARTGLVVDDRLLDGAPALRVVGRAGVGLDTIDVAACRRRDIEVVYTPGANTQAVVEYVLGLLCDLLRPRVKLTGAVDAERWRGLRREQVGRRQLGDLRIGVLGYGRIGSALGRALGGLGCTVRYHDLREIPAPERHGATPVDLRTLVESSDVLSVHVDGRPGNRDLVGRALLPLLPAGAVLVNTSRGFVVDKDSLATLLAARPDVHAVLDVHTEEPILAGDPLLDRPNAHLYPHLAGRTEAAVAGMGWVVRDVIAVLAGERPAHPAPHDDPG